MTKNAADKDFLSAHNLRRVVNAAGTMTGLGANRIVPEAVAAAAAISPHFVEIDALQENAAEVIAEATGAESGCLTACSAAGVTLSIAACMTGTDLAKVEQLPNTDGMPSQVLLQSGHAINYGAPIEQAVRLAGARVAYVGGATEAHIYQLRARLREGGIAAALYVVSHHTAQEGMISLEDWTAACHEYDVPVIADMASEFNLRVAENPGVDAAIYSAHKFIGGPTAGIVAARAALTRAISMQNRGIGRQMKIGKEGICGAIAALQAWLHRDWASEQAQHRQTLALWEKMLENTPGLQTEIIPDWTRNPIDRLQISVTPDIAGLYAWELAMRLREGAPAVFVREQFVEHGRLVLDPCHLEEGEAEVVASRIREIVADAPKNKRRTSWDAYKKQAAAAADDPVLRTSPKKT